MILYVGKLTETKGVSYLIKAIPKVIQKYSDTKFVFVGGTYYGEVGNPYKKLIRNLEIKRNVIFTGPIEENELPRIYSSADLFVLPSLREGMPLVVMESLSSGTPVISTKVSGASEIIDESVGLLIRKKSPEAIANSILHLISNKQKLKNISIQARKRVLNFDKNKQVRKYKELYESLIGV